MTSIESAPCRCNSLPVPLDNAHAHLRALGSRSGTAGGYLSLCSTNHSDWGDVAHAANASQGVIIPSFGTHPWMFDDNFELDAGKLSAMLDRYPHAGLGETGLDKSSRAKASIGHQKHILRGHIDLSRRYDRVITLHCVRAWGSLLEVLAEEKPARFLIHGWNAAPDMLAPYLKLGACFSLNLRSLHSIDVGEFLSRVPPFRLLVETDDEETGLEETYGILHEASGGAVTRELLHRNFSTLFRVESAS